MMLDRINAFCTSGFTIFMIPLSHLSPAWAMVILSLVIGTALVWLFGRTSNQAAIASIKDRISGNLLAVRLFKHDLGIVMGLQGNLLLLTLHYLLHSMLPMLVMGLPVAFLLAQMNGWFGVHNLRPGSTALLKVTVRDAMQLNDISLEGTRAVQVDSPAVHIAPERQIAWRIKAVAAGDEPLTIHACGQEITKSIRVGNQWQPGSPLRSSKASDQFLFPQEPALNADPIVESIALTLPSLPLRICGIELPWLAWFFILTMIFGFALKGLLGVQI